MSNPASSLGAGSSSDVAFPSHASSVSSSMGPRAAAVPENHMMAAGSSGAGNNGSSSNIAAAATSPLLWARSQKLPEEFFRQLHQIYGEHFPLEARHHLAGWLEASFIDSEEFDQSNPTHVEHARHLVMTLIQQLEEKARESNDFLLKTTFHNIVDSFKVSFWWLDEWIFKKVIDVLRHFN